MLIDQLAKKQNVITHDKIFKLTYLFSQWRKYLSGQTNNIYE